MASHGLCMICLDLDCQATIEVCHKSTDKVCQTCIRQYVEAKIEDGYSGSCPVLWCPLCTGRGRCLLSFKDLKPSIPSEILARYQSLAESLLSIQCSKCHIRSSLMVSDSQDDDNMDRVSLVVNVSMRDSWRSVLLDFEHGLIDVPKFYELIVSQYFTDVLTNKDDVTSWNVMSQVLAMVMNPERRANLHLRHLRSRPRIWTKCCRIEQCFRCRTRTYHDGRSCEEVSVSLGGDIVRCQVCGVHIVKGDGCDHVTCVCGSSFAFNSELLKTKNAARFQESFPYRTSRMCVEVLCGSQPGNNTHALAWKEGHKEEYFQHSSDWWKNTFPECPSQCAFLFPIDPPLFQTKYCNSGVADACRIWSRLHVKDVEHCQLQHETAAKESRTFAHSLWFSPVRSTDGRVPFKSIQSEAMQFLILFGRREAQLQQCDVSHVGDVLAFSRNFHTITTGGRACTADECPLSNTFLTGFLSSLRLNVADNVSMRNETGEFGVVIRDNDDGTYEVNWGCVVNTQHRASLKYEHSCVKVTPTIPMSGQQLKTFNSYLCYLKILLTPEGDAARADDGLVKVWEDALGGSELEARREVDRIKKILFVIKDPTHLQELCHLDALLPEDYEYRLKWVDLYFACGWAGEKARDLCE